MDDNEKNPIFKAQVTALFEKTAFLQDPNAVLAKMPHEDSGDLRRGLALMEGAKGTAHALKDVAGAGYGALSKFVSPSGNGGGILSRGLEHASAFASKRPALARTAVGAAALAPILGNAFLSSQALHERELMDAYAQPDRVITSSLEEFLEKKAELYSMTKQAVAARPFSFGNSLGEGVSKGLGSAIGGTGLALLVQALGGGLGALHDKFSGDPKRKALVASILRSDPVLSDAVQRHPDSKRMVEEAYATMARFAPTLSKDPNAVRSFLREAVLGGAGVNYATIKNLVDTEKSIAEAKPRYGQGH